MDEFYAVYKELGREPLDSNLVPDPKKKWYERDTDLYRKFTQVNGVLERDSVTYAIRMNR